MPTKTAKPSTAEPETPEAEAPANPIVPADPQDSEPVGRSTSKDKSKREHWEHDGKFYELAKLGDFGIGDQQRLNRDGRVFYQLWTSEEDLTDDQQKQLKFVLERLFDKVLVAPKVVKRTFGDDSKAEVVLHFTLAPLRKMMEAAAQEQEQTEAQDGESTPTT